MLDELRAELLAADAEKLAAWQRSLPIPELIGDRWDRARRLGFGSGSSIYDSAIVMGEVDVGENVWIGPSTLLDGTGGGLRIGDWCNVSAGVQIYSHDTVLNVLSGGRVPPKTGPVSIGARTYIGPHAVLAGGVSIGSLSVIGACSFVNRSVPNRVVVAGAPARVIGVVEGDDDDVRIVHYAPGPSAH